VIDTGLPAIFALRAEWKQNVTVALHNLASVPCTVPLELPDKEAERLVDTLPGAGSAELKDGACEIDLEPYGFRWLKVVSSKGPTGKDQRQRAKDAAAGQSQGQRRRSK
jgi:maltose alpha-D-glucosyltransferase / alpha-amylase